MKSENEVPKTLQDLLRKRGAPTMLKSDNAKAVMGEQNQDILRHYCIGSK